VGCARAVNDCKAHLRPQSRGAPLGLRVMSCTSAGQRIRAARWCQARSRNTLAMEHKPGHACGPPFSREVTTGGQRRRAAPTSARRSPYAWAWSCHTLPLVHVYDLVRAAARGPGQACDTGSLTLYLCPAPGRAPPGRRLAAHAAARAAGLAVLGHVGAVPAHGPRPRHRRRAPHRPCFHLA